MHLFQPKDALCAKDKNHREHATPVRSLLNQRSMRALGQAFDRGIIKDRKVAKTS